MCQDNIKIREEGELENESVQNVLKQPLIIRKVLESLDFSSLLHCRIVSKSWEKEATFIMSKRCNVTIKNVESLQDFMGTHPIPSNNNSDAAQLAIADAPLFSHVTFQFDVEAEAKKEDVPDTLRAFLLGYAKQLSSIETPNITLTGKDSVSEWTEKTLRSMIVPDENKTEDKEVIQDKLETTPDIIDDNNNAVTSGKKDDQPAILDENANLVVENNSCGMSANDVKVEDESGLQEIIIHDDDVVDEKIDSEIKSKSLAPTLDKPRKSVHFSMVENPDYVPIPYCDEGYSNFSEFYPYYLGEHAHGPARRLHVLGITSSIILIIIGTFTLNPILYAVAIIQAYVLSIGSHLYFEKRIPRPTIRNPIYMVMGNLKMWWEIASGSRVL